jgi:hypothetical protein
MLLQTTFLRLIFVFDWTIYFVKNLPQSISMENFENQLRGIGAFRQVPVNLESAAVQGARAP